MEETHFGMYRPGHVSSGGLPHNRSRCSCCTWSWFFPVFSVQLSYLLAMRRSARAYGFYSGLRLFPVLLHVASCASMWLSRLLWKRSVRAGGRTLVEAISVLADERVLGHSFCACWWTFSCGRAPVLSVERAHVRRAPCLLMDAL